jgi:eukaryotic-like serine/threonine-protein kinase
MDRESLRRHTGLIAPAARPAHIIASLLALTPGTRLGVYEVIALLGEGGMGQVYRATDTRLKRQVAIKILPPSVATDHDRLARFQREAEVLASLNHPNIAGIYGLEESGGATALVMELVEGEELSAIIARGPIPVAEALPVAKQIADALETAHDLGIIHRDLKPANVKVRDDGTAKVLDFGLAKALDPASASNADAMNSPTLTDRATQLGVILGTASYMAPEQARGRVVDKRADVWAFGVVLYEMLTGTRAFPGDDVSDTLATVLKFDPDWSKLPADTPPSIRRLLKRCLTKDPKLRLRECGSALLDIRDALASPDGAESPLLSTDAKPVPDHRQRALIATAALALGAVVGAVGWTTLYGGAKNSPPQTTRRASIPLPEGDVLPLGQGTLLAISPDGRTLVYRARRGTAVHLFRRAIDQFDAAMIPGTEGASAPFVSVDGAWIGFIERSVPNPALKKIPISGGRPQPLATGRGMGSATWTKDSRIIWAEDGGSLKSVPAAGGEPTPVFKADGKFAVFSPQLLADNSLLLTTLPAGRLPGDGEIVVVKRGTGEKKTVQPNAWAGLVLPSGHLVFVRGSALWAVPFDSDRLEVVGTAVPVVHGVRVEPGGAVQFAVADDGTLAYVPGTALEGDRPLAFVGRDGGQPEVLKIPARDYLNVALSPDQTRVATQIGEGDDADVWVGEIARGTLGRVTSEPGFDGYPMWSGDSKRIVFASARNGRWTLQSRAADGTGEATRIIAFDASVASAVPFAWSPDGSTLLFGANAEVGVISAGSKGEWNPVIRSAREAARSPNGRWIAYSSLSRVLWSSISRGTPTRANGTWSQPVWATRPGGHATRGSSSIFAAVRQTR